MNATGINQSFDLLTLAGEDTHLRQQGAYHVGPCPFCAGVDRFVVKMTPTGQLWYCRKCGDGKYHTGIDYVMRRDSLDFKTALAHMGGNLSKSPSSMPRDVSKALLALPDSSWQAQAWGLIDGASDRLLFEPAGQAGRAYLTRRGLHRGTWGAWLLGFAIIYGRPAITIPWLDFDSIENAIVMAVKYRFIDDLAQRDKKHRYGQTAGGVSLLFGLGYALPTDDTLLLIEGEFNALSVAQCMPKGVTCLSIGSASGGNTPILRAVAGRYRRVFVWADEAGRASQLRSRIRGAGALQSPQQRGDKWDANKLLQEGLLAPFLSQSLGIECMEP
jgi:hypothetical protein